MKLSKGIPNNGLNGSKRHSQYRGVYRCGKKWKSQSKPLYSHPHMLYPPYDVCDELHVMTVQINGKQEYLGTFITEEEAAAAYDIRALECGRAECVNYVPAGSRGVGTLYSTLKAKIRLGKVVLQLYHARKEFSQSLLRSINAENDTCQHLSVLLETIEALTVKRRLVIDELHSIVPASVTHSSCA